MENNGSLVYIFEWAPAMHMDVSCGRFDVSCWQLTGLKQLRKYLF